MGDGDGSARALADRSGIPVFSALSLDGLVMVDACFRIEEGKLPDVHPDAEILLHQTLHQLEHRFIIFRDLQTLIPSVLLPAGRFRGADDPDLLHSEPVHFHHGIIHYIQVAPVDVGLHPHAEALFLAEPDGADGLFLRAGPVRSQS